jgi:hypothetical protein
MILTMRVETDLEPTTTFGEGKSTVPSAPVPVDAALLAALVSLQTETLDTACDFALYRIGAREQHRWTGKP